MPKGNANPIQHGVKQEEGEWEPRDRVRHSVPNVVIVELVSEEEVHEIDRLLFDGLVVVPVEVIANGVDDRERECLAVDCGGPDPTILPTTDVRVLQAVLLACVGLLQLLLVDHLHATVDEQKDESGSRKNQ